MRRLEDSVASNVVSHAPNVLAHLTVKFAIGDAHISEERNEVVWGICAVRAAVIETGRRQWFCKQLLAAER